MTKRATCQHIMDKRATVGARAPATCDEPVYWATGETPAGTLIVAVTRHGVCYSALGEAGSEAALVADVQRRFPARSIERSATHAGDALARIAALVNFPADARAIALASGLSADLEGTEFQRDVWKQLREIPVGTTITYAELAHRIGRPKAHRAVAQACGANPVAVLVPCHRVIGSDGTLAGYRWGVERKRLLLERESAQL